MNDEKTLRARLVGGPFDGNWTTATPGSDMINITRGFDRHIYSLSGPDILGLEFVFEYSGCEAYGALDVPEWKRRQDEVIFGE